MLMASAYRKGPQLSTKRGWKFRNCQLRAVFFSPRAGEMCIRDRYCTTPGDQDRLTLSGVTGLKADSSLLASSGCTCLLYTSRCV